MEEGKKSCRICRIRRTKKVNKKREYNELNNICNLCSKNQRLENKRVCLNCYNNCIKKLEKANKNRVKQNNHYWNLDNKIIFRKL